MFLEIGNKRETKERSKRMLKEIKSVEQLEFDFSVNNNKENVQRTESPLEKLYKDSEREGALMILMPRLRSPLRLG